MKDGNSTWDVEMVRAQLHRMVDDVEPSPDALPKLLAGTRRRKAPRRPLFAAIGAVAVAAVALVVALVVMPGQQQPAPVSAQPNSYLATLEPGVIASFDIFSGQQNGVLADVPGADPEVLTTDRNRVLAATSTSDGRRLVEIAADGAQHVLPVPPGDLRLLAAGGGRIAYPDADSVVLLRGGQQQRIALPAGTRVDDLALSDDGRLALLAAEPGRDQASVLVLARDATSLAGHVEAASEDCGPVAITWSGRDIAALEPPACGDGQARVATFAADSGRKIGAGVPFRTPELAVGAVRISADPLGRFLVSTDGRGQWLVDGSAVRPLPPACTGDGGCATGPGTFWS
ncbi:hypothetical protein SAMN02982929_05774 [Saccharopolyspora kobensis]|uniref:FbpC C-terminal regulatory nucleotide binding domain-containing protein n=1 Tax=Saccharopolyspora kobensis TaxID=146035 RepID=A0A1H6E8R3_9PSEU|nr:hypothetical protein [Saccharopolyspora kobensis]SEG93245.1 hypothetical protein SAMN02982929_05774 [Saccharopolyspora kobensis]SFD43828.1 hypothetical protein SAMN05216506_104303 [Saccharopolyspora kobensis]